MRLGLLKEHGLGVPPVCAGLGFGPVILLEFKEGELGLSGGFLLFAAQFKDRAPRVPLTVDLDEPHRLNVRISTMRRAL
jgi:hypothetical protein